MAATADPGGAHVLGPFARRAGLRRALEAVSDAYGLRTCEEPLRPDPRGSACWRAEVGTCSAPCIDRIAEGDYGRNLLRALNAISGGRAALQLLERQRDRLAEMERFEAAGRVQRQIAASTRLRRVLRPVRLALDWDDALVVQPGAEPGTVAIWAVLGGRVAHCGQGRAEDLAQLFVRLWESARQRHQRDYAERGEVDAARVIHRWLRRPANRQWVAALRGTGREAAWRQVQAAAERCLDRLL